MLIRAATLILLFALAAGSALAADAPAKRADPCHDAIFARARFSSSIGFSAVAPKGYEAGRDSMSCTATSVAGVRLGCTCSGDDHQRYIALDDELEQISITGKKDGRLRGRPEPLAWHVDLEISVYRDEARHGTFRILKREKTRLGSLPAQRVLMQYTTANGRQMITDLTIALRAAKDKSADYEYVVSMDALAAHYPAHRKLLEAVLQSWRAIAVQRN